MSENKNTNDDLFITEDDTFDITIKWYKKDGDLCVKDITDEYDNDFEEINEFTVTFKYPNQGDYEAISKSGENKSPEDLKIADIVGLELARLVVLIRSWSLEQEMSKLVLLDPDIVKGMIKAVQDELGMIGIF